jgi:4-amino-4-deoxy-L-arabinose transferase-like glycosyltransferase
VWPWFLPLVFFAAWAGIGVWQSPEFYEQVVEREFLGRFTVGEEAVHHNFGPHFYFFQLLHKWMPWSVGLLALCSLRRVRAALHAEPALIWLLCWALGGLVFMSLVPSKRVDRIFPVLPPLCLLAAALYDRASRAEPARWRKFAFIALAIGLASAGGYTVWRVLDSHRTQQGALVAFGAQVRALAAAHPDRLAVIDAKDEGLAMYCGAVRFTDDDVAVKLWRAGRLDWLVLDERKLAEHAESLHPFRRALAVPRLPRKHGSYVGLAR